MNLNQNIKDKVFKALEVFDKSELADHRPAQKSFLELLKASEDPRFNQEDIIKQIKLKKNSISSKICSIKTQVAKSGLSFISALAKSLKHDFKPFIHTFIPSVLKIMQRKCRVLNPVSYECLKDIIQVCPYPDLFDIFSQHYKLSHPFLKTSLPIFLDYCVYEFDENFIKAKFNQIEKIILYYLGHSDLTCRQVSQLTYACYIARVPSRKEDLDRNIISAGVKDTGSEPPSETFKLLIRSSDLSVFNGASVTLPGPSSRLSSSKPSTANFTQFRTKASSATYPKPTHTHKASFSSVSQSLSLTQESITAKSRAMRQSSFSSTSASCLSSTSSLSTKGNKIIFDQMADYSHVKSKIDTKSVSLKPRVKKNFLELNKQRATIKRTPGVMPPIFEQARPGANIPISTNSPPLKSLIFKQSGSTLSLKAPSTSNMSATQSHLSLKRPLLSDLLGSDKETLLSKHSAKPNSSKHPYSSNLSPISSEHQILTHSKYQSEELSTQQTSIISSNRKKIPEADSKEFSGITKKCLDTLEQVYEAPCEALANFFQDPHSQFSNSAPNSSIHHSDQSSITLVSSSQSLNNNTIKLQTQISNGSSSHGPNTFIYSNLNSNTLLTQTTTQSHPTLSLVSSEPSKVTFPIQYSNKIVSSLPTPPIVAPSLSHQDKRTYAPTSTTYISPSPSKRSRHC